MDLSKFTDQSPGTVVAIADGEHAFVPDPVPLDWEFPARLWPLLMEAKQRTALLEGIGRTLPDPALLLQPMANREAIQSSRLEGTYATARELLLFEMAPKDAVSGGSEAQANDWLEVYNYREALRYSTKSDLPLSLRLVRDLHRILMTGVRGKDKTPGEFRKQQVAIGSNFRFVPPPPQHLMECLNSFERQLHAPTSVDPLVKAFLFHYQFETIHPFMDGNGRVGRAVLALMLQVGCGLTKPWLYLSGYFEKHRDEYCERMFDVSAHAAWSEWVELCLNATIHQANVAISRCEALRGLRQEFDTRIHATSGSVRLFRIVERLFTTPYVRISDLAAWLDTTYPTAAKDVDRLVTAGILVQLSNTTPKTFFSPEIHRAAYQDLEDPVEE